MPTILNLLTRPTDSLAQEIIAEQRLLGTHEIECVDLSQPDPDYRSLVKRIFAADSVQVW